MARFYSLFLLSFLSPPPLPSLCAAMFCGDGRALNDLLNELCGCTDKSMIKRNDINSVIYRLVFLLMLPSSLAGPGIPVLTFVPVKVFALCFALQTTFLFLHVCHMYLLTVSFVSPPWSVYPLTTSLSLPSSLTLPLYWSSHSFLSLHSTGPL